MTDINIDIHIRNADAYKNIARVAEGIREELRELFEDEAVPPVEITVEEAEEIAGKLARAVTDARRDLERGREER